MRKVAILATVFVVLFAAPAAYPFCFGTIHVHVFNDTNRNGALDPGETPRQGVVVQLDQLADGTIESSLTTDANGDVNFFVPAVVQYAIHIVAPAGTTQTSPDPPADYIICVGVVDFSFGLSPQPVPALSRGMLMLLALSLGGMALLVLRR